MDQMDILLITIFVGFRCVYMCCALTGCACLDCICPYILFHTNCMLSAFDHTLVSDVFLLAFFAQFVLLNNENDKSMHWKIVYNITLKDRLYNNKLFHFNIPCIVFWTYFAAMSFKFGGGIFLCLIMWWFSIICALGESDNSQKLQEYLNTNSLW